MASDATAPLAIKAFRAMGGKTVWKLIQTLSFRGNNLRKPIHSSEVQPGTGYEIQRLERNHDFAGEGHI